jgi:UDP-2,3-diacylglucosamine hydrolase
MVSAKAVERAVFISDVHLLPREGRKALILCDFLKTIKGEALFILGDFFDFWVGEEQLRIMDCADIFAEMQNLSTNGTKICFLRGNRDFLLNRRSVRSFGASMLGSRIEIFLKEQRACLSHGDDYLINDETYLLFKAITRQPLLKAAFKHLVPFSIRMAFAKRIREESSISVKRKVRRSERVVELSKRAIIERFKSGYDVMVCGHIHKPTITKFRISEKTHTFYTLGNWTEKGGWYLIFDDGLFVLKHFPSGEQLTESSPKVPSLF